ncbi:MAG TPA: SDR family oxidoreductase [Phnomibacter sp.]|nr:SDR family oxidoreductase [Phnomibacter sp.]
MDLQIHQQWFLVGGATSGLGQGIALRLLAEGANVLAIARNGQALQQLQAQYPNQVRTLAASLTEPATIALIKHELQGLAPLAGVVLNAGGPPALPALQTTLAHWDEAYHQVFRWKVALTQALLPALQANHYGRLLYIESASIKQPMENLALSTAMRLAVAGYVKTLSAELAPQGITLNILAPGLHNTAALQRIFDAKAAQTGKDAQEIRTQTIAQLPMATLGQPQDFATLAAWLLSPHSRFVTGQTWAVEGGSIKGIM